MTGVMPAIAAAPSEPILPASWKDILRIPGQVEEIDLDSVISGFFPGDAEFSKTVVDCVDKILSTGDVHKWAEFKRLDAHAAKHQRIASDYLLNLTWMLIDRLCSLSGEKFCVQFRDIVYDRIENFHNQCKDEIPQSVSRHKARHEFLHSYNVKSYRSILSVLGTVLLKADLTTAQELAKRIASNHNHWFNFVHIIEFTKSMIDARDESDLVVSLGPALCALAAGMCGTRLGMDPSGPSLIDATGVQLPVWVGATLIDLLELATRRRVDSSVANAALNALASLNYGVQPGLARMVLNRIIGNLNDIADLALGEELLNCLICMMRFVEVSEYHLVELETASSRILKLALSSAKKTQRFKTLCLKWLRVVCYGPILSGQDVAASSGVLFCWRALLSLDSPVFAFLIECLEPAAEYSPETSLTCSAAVELIRLLMQRDALAVSVMPKNELIPIANLLVKPTKTAGKQSACPLATILLCAFKLRRCRKACAYILHQAVVRVPTSVRQVLYGTDYEDSCFSKESLSENLARVLLDSAWETEVDVYSSLKDIDVIDFEALNLAESVSLSNLSTVTLLSLNSVLETLWLYKLGCWCELNDAPAVIKDRIEYWLIHDNIVSLSSELGGSVFHLMSARMLGLVALYESSGGLTAELLGLVETSTGVVNNDLEKTLQCIDALFLLLDAPPADAPGSMADIEYLYALRVVSQTMDESMNRQVIVRFIQYRWVHRFSILRLLIDSIRDQKSHDEIPILTTVLQVTELLKVIGVELEVASRLVDTDADHVRNMKDFGQAFIVSDLARGRSCFVQVIEAAFRELQVSRLLPKDLSFILPELKDPRLESLNSNEDVLNFVAVSGLVDAVVSVVVSWASLSNESERFEVLSFMIESVNLIDCSDLARQILMRQFVAKLYAVISSAALSGTMLAFNLRTLTMLLDQLSCSKNLLTRSGIMEALAYACIPFVGSAEIWMIEREPVMARRLTEAILEFSLDVVESGDKQDASKVMLPLTVLYSLLSTRQSFSLIEITQDLTGDRYKPQIAKLVSSHVPTVVQLVKEILDVVAKEILYKELAI